jgi:hypothetical protein
MITFQDILAKASTEAIEKLRSFVAQGLIRESQLGLIMQKTFKSKIQNGDFSFKVDIAKLICLLIWLERFQVGRQDPKALVATIKRLTSKNGDETFNEFCAHSILLTLFKNYRIMPLYGQGEDGRVLIEKGYIPVEIKSRFPEKYELLSLFFSEMDSALYSITNNLDVVCNIKILSIRDLSAEIIRQEVSFIRQANDASDFVNIARYPIWHTVKRAVGLFSYELEFSFRDAQSNRTEIGLDEAMERYNVINPFRYGIGATALTNMYLGGTRELMLCLADSVKQELAYALVTQCIKSAKNLPDEPRIITIYTSHGLEALKFVISVVDDYIAKHDRTAILIVSSYFSEEIQHSFRIIYSKYGTGLEEFKSLF